MTISSLWHLTQLILGHFKRRILQRSTICGVSYVSLNDECIEHCDRRAGAKPRKMFSPLITVFSDRANCSHSGRTGHSPR